MGAWANDADCDGFTTAADCDDNDAAIGEIDNPKRCFKVLTTFVDATLANTDIASGGIDDSLWANGDDGTTGGDIEVGAIAADQKWRFRTIFESTVWEATSSNATTEDCVEIVSSVSGLENGSYHLFVFFYTVNFDGTYPIRAGFTSDPGNNQIWSRDPEIGILAGFDALAKMTFVNPPDFDTGSRTIRYGYLGEAIVTDGTLSIYIDDFPATDSYERTWYEGFGYAPVGP